ncbi:phage distal tail protein [Streptomyces virginiae]|uniref:phage distal tail protein n=1 Tax=Streptomyces TaxID=1883 RepID=UPI000F3A8F41|nr:phage tail domain-containing protein [Streptomyces sp. ADI95-16]AYV29635.1 Phage tail protein [Streptomyces sp. ADI95-16]
MPIPASYNQQPDAGGTVLPDHQPVRWPRTFVTWTGSNGDVIPLTGDITGRESPAGIAITKGPAGMGMPTFDLKADQLPNMAGGLFRSARATTRDITIPLIVRGIDRTSTVRMNGRLLRALDPYAGPGWITVTEGDGVARHLECYYVSGAEGSEAQENAAFTWFRHALVLRAMDPYWYSNAERQHDWSAGNGPLLPFLSGGSYPGFFPMRITSAGLGSDGLVDAVNDSAVEAWPVWTIYGPLSGLSLANTTTGKTFRLREEAILPGGKALTIDTRPGIKSAEIDGVNAWPKVQVESQLWPLRPGKNRIRVTAAAVSATTLIRMHYVPRYLSYSGG